VVLEVGDQDFIAGLDLAASPAVGHQVDGLGGAAHEHDLAGRARVEVPAHDFTRLLVRIGCPLAERMHAAMHIGVQRRLVVLDRAQHRQGPLR